MEDAHIEKIISYLQGQLNPAGRDEFYAWTSADAANKKLYFEIKVLYDACLSSGTPLDTEESWLRLLRKREATRFTLRNLWYRIGTYAAVSMIAVTLTSTFFLVFSRTGQDHPTRYIGGNGLEADVVELPDGTHVSLGTKTNFHFDANYGKKDRIVYLEGEAYFEVAKEKDKPFIVKTKEQNIEALGTKFNVMAYPLDSLLTTTLLQGSVLLTTTEIPHRTILNQDEQLIYNRNTRSSVVHKVDAKQFAAWTTGYYFFPEQSLEAILYRLSHVYGVQFTVMSPDLNHRTFTGTFYRGQSIENIMEIIRLSVPVKYKIKDRHVTISEIK